MEKFEFKAQHKVVCDHCSLSGHSRGFYYDNINMYYWDEGVVSYVVGLELLEKSNLTESVSQDLLLKTIATMQNPELAFKS